MSKKSYQGKDFLTLADLTKEELEQLILLAVEIKNKLKNGISFQPLAGKTLGMIFEKASTRTRVSFEVGMLQLGGHALFLSNRDIQIGRGETISDTAKVLSRYVDAILMRTDDQEKLVELAENSTVPIINGLSELYHPTQAIADIITIYEHKGNWKGLKLVYIGDGNNMVHSLLILGSKLGMNVSVVTPKGYEPNNDIVKEAKKCATENGCTIEITNDIEKAATKADIIYTDVWTSMGHEAENEKRLNDFKDYQINSEVTKLAKEDYIFLHCLPAHREEEVSAEVIDGPNSVVFDQAENRLHAHKAILTTLLT